METAGTASDMTENKDDGAVCIEEPNTNFLILGTSDTVQRRGELHGREDSGGATLGDRELPTDSPTAKSSAAMRDYDGSSGSSHCGNVGIVRIMKTLIPHPSNAFRKKGRKRKTAQIMSSFSNDDDSRKPRCPSPTALFELAVAGENSELAPSKREDVDCENVNKAITTCHEKIKFVGDSEDAFANYESDGSNHRSSQAQYDCIPTIQMQKQDQKQSQQQQQNLALRQQQEVQLLEQRQRSQQQLNCRFHCSNDNNNHGHKVALQHDWHKSSGILVSNDKQNVIASGTPLDNTSINNGIAREEMRGGGEMTCDERSDNIDPESIALMPDKHKLVEQSTKQKQLPQQQQPPGWRVKLYRLNVDGTWDDCGTGRIQFYFARNCHQHNQSRLQLHRDLKLHLSDQINPQEETRMSSSSSGHVEDETTERKEGPHISSSVSSISSHSHSNSAYYDLGEPMLCMRAEIPPTQEQVEQNKQNIDGDASINRQYSNFSSPPTHGLLRVILRTRVLLHESAYQCQGGNIITWCEPFDTSQDELQKQNDNESRSQRPSSSASNIITGIDLALSFQENAGCKDIWQHITSVQARAKDLLLVKSNFQKETNAFQPQNQLSVQNCGNDDAVRQGNSNRSSAYGEEMLEECHDIGLHHNDHQKRHHHNHHPPSEDHVQLSTTHHSPTQLHHNYHYSLQNSPHSPDHDAMEDHQLSLVPSARRHQSLITPSRLPLAPVPAAALSSKDGSTEKTKATTEIEMHQNNNDPMYLNVQSSDDNHSNESSDSLDLHHQKDMMAVSMAAAAAAPSYRSGTTTPSSPSTVSRRNGSIQEENENIFCSVSSASSTDDRYEINQHLLNPLPEGVENQQLQRQGFSIEIDSASNSSSSSSSSIDNNTAGFVNDDENGSTSLTTVRFHFPPNDPTWDDLHSLREYIDNIQYGVGERVYQSINILLLQREELLTYLASDDCSNLKKILQLFYDRKARDGHESDNEQTLIESGSRFLAGIVKSILLLNDPEVIEYVTTDVSTFEDVCAVLEYDPELQTKADHIEFFRKHAKFHTVVPMDDGDHHKDLVSNIHRLFRVNYLRDVILRPTMDESNLSALVSLGQFTMNDIIRGVMTMHTFPTMSHGNKEEVHDEEAKVNENKVENKSSDDTLSTNSSNTDENYFTRVIRVFGRENYSIRCMTWEETHNEARKMDNNATNECDAPSIEVASKQPMSGARESSSTCIASKKSQPVTWQQHVAPQDETLPSRMLRRTGCLMFLNELFNMARISLQPHEKDNFIEAALSAAVSLSFGCDETQGLAVSKEITGSFPDVCEENIIISAHPPKQRTSSSFPHQESHVTLLSLLSATLSDPTAGTKERGAALEILSVITMHDPSLIRKYCLDYAACTNSGVADYVATHRPDPNNLYEVLFVCEPDDLILALLFVMATEIDAGLLLQTSEIIRIILDTEMIADQLGGGPTSPPGHDRGGEFLDDDLDINLAHACGSSGKPCLGERIGRCKGGEAKSVEDEQNSFLAIFYDRYVHWLVAPFQYSLFVLQMVPPESMNADRTISLLRREFRERTPASSPSRFFNPIEPCPVRLSFALEILSFCVQTHVHRMKFFVLKSRMLISILKLLDRREEPVVTGPKLPSGIRCLKLASLKLLRSVLSVKNEFYYRHIIQYNLFAPVFDLFRERSKSVGNNLLSSAILEMCDFVRQENIKSLIDYIVLQHLSAKTEDDGSKAISSLEDIAKPFVTTFQQFREVHEKNHNTGDHRKQIPLGTSELNQVMNGSMDDHDDLMCSKGRQVLSKAAIEDQRKFHQADEDDSYFNDDE